MTDSEKLAYGRAYSRGYNAGLRGQWHAYKPPRPPDPLLAAFFAAAVALRDAVASELPMYDEGDPIAARLGPPLDALTEAMAGVTEWVTASDDSA